MESNKIHDNFSIRYSLCGLLLLLPYIITQCFPGYDVANILVIYGTLLVSPILGLCFVTILIMHSWIKRWRRAASLLIARFFGLAVSAAIVESHFPLWLCLQVNKYEYLRQIAQVPRTDNAPIKKSFLVGYYGMAFSASGEYTIEYDESDFAEMLDRSKHCAKITHLEGHFYYVMTEEQECTN